MTYTQYLVLSVVWEKDGLTIGAIGERLALEPSTITPAVKRLEAAGFLTRRRSSTDERLVEVHLTQKGASLHPKTGCLTDALLRHSGFDVPQMIALNKLVQTLRQGMREATAGQSETVRGDAAD
ncbi:MarR family transcriptional regulator [Bosea vaviloviae]|uniref:MarR family transcriptional regulator n=1 Tax=Bosea vaviloviae TaxID=1526658 RepID=UPI00313A2F4D